MHEIISRYVKGDEIAVLEKEFPDLDLSYLRKYKDLRKAFQRKRTEVSKLKSALRTDSITSLRREHAIQIAEMEEKHRKHNESMKRFHKREVSELKREILGLEWKVAGLSSRDMVQWEQDQYEEDMEEYNTHITRQSRKNAETLDHDAA